MYNKFNIITLFAGLISFSAIFGMKNDASPGMQKLAKHKAEFQAGIQKLQDFIPARDLDQVFGPDCGLTPTSRALFAAAERDMRNRAQSIAKELETAFNAISANQVGPQAIATQKIEKPIAALKKLWEQLHTINPEASMAAASFSAHDIAVYGPVARKNAQLFQDIVKELETAFNGISANQGESQAIVTQRVEKLAGLKKLWELANLANHDYVADWAATDHSDSDKAFFSEEARQRALVYKEIAKEVEAAIAERDELIARLQMQKSPQQAVSTQEYQSLADTLAQVRTQSQETTIALYDLAAAHSKKELAVKSLESKLEEKDVEIAQLKQQNSQVSAQSQDFQKRMQSLLALFEASKATGWEILFVEAIKAEL